MAATGRALVHRRVDGWLLGGVGVVAWLLLGPLGPAGSAGPITGILSGAFITLGAMHFGASYHLAYAGGAASVRRHPLALAVAPVVLLAAAIAVVVLSSTHHDLLARGLLRSMLVSVFTLTGWHYVKQAYGVGMLSARSGGLQPARREALVLRYALYPVWLYDVLEIWGRGRTGRYGAYDVTVDLVPQAATRVFQVAAVGSLLLALGLIVRLSVEARVVPPLGLWGAYLAGGLWLIWPPSYVSGAVVLAGVHGLQYIACAHRAEVDLAVEQREAHLLHRWLCVFGGAAAGGILLTTWVPDHLGGALSSTAVPGLVAAVVFAYFNLHHYAVDAAIWRSGGEHVVRMSRGPQPLAAPVGSGPTPVAASGHAPSPALT